MRLRYLCLAGPTAAGKTAATLALARELPLEVVSVDSALVYRGMDIGTAKPDEAERAAVPHHLIDLIDPAEAYSAARFVAEARAAIEAIRGRGRLPLLAGGTMLYFKALFDGMDRLPAADPVLRERIAAEARERGWPALHAELARVDPASAARLAPHDAQRIQRALEVWQASGTPLSALQSGRFEGDAAAPADTALISLEPADRAALHGRIGERFAAMLDAGLVDEVRRLRARGDLHAGLPSMRCVGYRQVWEALGRRAGPGAGRPAAARRAGPAAGARRRGHAPARQAPADLAALDALAPRGRLRSARRGGPGRRAVAPPAGGCGMNVPRAAGRRRSR